MRDNTSFFKTLESFKCNKKKNNFNKAKTHAQLKLRLKSWNIYPCWSIIDRNEYSLSLFKKGWMLQICKVRKLAELYIYSEKNFRKISAVQIEHGIEEAIDWADEFLNRCDEIEAKNKAGNLIPRDVDDDSEIPLL